MKFNSKHALAALAIAIAGQAGAQTISATSDTGNSSYYFVAVDDVAGRSYFTQLVANAGSTTTGVMHLDDLISNPNGNWTVTLTGLNTFAAGSASLDNIFAGFGAGDTSATVGGGTSPATGNRRIVTSIATGSSAPTYSNSSVTSAGTAFSTFANAVNALPCAAQCIATSSSQTEFAGLANSIGLGLQWGNPAGPLIGDALSGTVAWDIYLAASSSAVLSAQSNVTALALHAVLDLATNVLTISSPNAVPVPAAVWLLGSAMLGLVGIGRRKKGQAEGQFDGAVAA